MTNMAKNPHGGLFGDDPTNPFGGFTDILEDLLRDQPRPARDTDPKRIALLKTFTEEVRKGDRAYLEKAVVDYQAEVFERDSDIPLMQAYAIASVFVGNLPAGYCSLIRIKNPTPEQRQAMAILAYEMGRPDDIANHLEGIEDKVAPARIVCSLSLYRKGNRDPQSHSELLEPLLERSGLANTIIGTLYFNLGDTEKAEESFAKAVQLVPNSERERLNLMTARVRNGKEEEVYSEMNQFYVDTGSRLSAEEVTQELEREALEIPSLKMGNLFEVIKSLIA